MRSLVAFVASMLLAVNGQDGPGGFGGEGASCKAFRCTKEKTAVPKRSMRLASPGCTMGGGMSMFSPGPNGDKDKDKELRPCCDQRHACISICGSSKKKCESLFKKCTENACNAIFDSEAKKKCESSSGLYTLMSSMGGCQDFDTAQLKACECVDKGKVEKKRSQILTDFYTKWGGEKKASAGDKVAKLLEKSSTPSAFAFTLMRLVNKFPAAIKQVKDPQASYMENLMKNAKKADTESDDTVTAGPTDSDLGIDEEEEEAVDLDGEEGKEEL